MTTNAALIVDLFAGGGGASTGIEAAIGRPVDIAVNHDPEAVSMHQANHPHTQHFVSDVFEVDPVAVTSGRPVGLLWASPDCTFHSKARGGKPFRDRNKARRRRGLAGVVVKWAAAVRPRVICMENVEEFQHWGPLLDDGTICPSRRGNSFRRWLAQLRNLGYQIDWRELRACDYGAPTIRKRLFIVARCDGLPIIWPEPTHGTQNDLLACNRLLQPWRTAADCIDWSIPAPSIFERKKPLADATCRRIAKGIMRYVVEAAEPFLVQYHSGKRFGDDRTANLKNPLPTQITENRFALTTAFLAKHYSGVVGQRADAPTGTVTTVDHHSLVTAQMVTIDNQSSHGGYSSATGPLKTTTTENRHALVTSNLVKLRGDNIGQPSDAPLATISAQGTHHAEVRAFLVKYYGTEQDPQMRKPLHTVTTKDRFGLVTVHGVDYEIIDIGLRMLTPRELFRAQGFPENYIIEHGADGRALTKTAQVRMCGNSVCPPIAEALVRANFISQSVTMRAAA